MSRERERFYDFWSWEYARRNVDLQKDCKKFAHTEKIYPRIDLESLCQWVNQFPYDYGEARRIFLKYGFLKLVVSI